MSFQPLTYRSISTTIYTCVLSLVFIGSTSLVAQSTDDEDAIKSEDIIIVKDYKVDIQNAKKIAVELPLILDSVKRKKLTYTPPTYLLKLNYPPLHLKAATHISQYDRGLSENYLKIGIGNQKSFLLDGGYITWPFSKGTAGIHIGHQSQTGNIEHQRNDIGHIRAVGSYRLKQSVAHASIGYNSHKTFFYGYNHSDTSFTKDQIRQKGRLFSMDLEWNSSPNHTAALNYENRIKAYHFSDIYNLKEAGIDLSVQFGYTFNESNEIITHTALQHTNTKQLTTQAQTNLLLSPTYKFQNDNWLLKGGLTINNYNNNWFLFPSIYTQTKLLEGQVDFYTYWHRALEVQTANNLFFSNPYIQQNISLTYTTTEERKAGIKGTLWDAVHYNTFIGSHVVKNQALFVSDSGTPNRFDVVYDPRMQITQLHLAAGAQFDRFVNLHTETNIRVYEPEIEEKAWHLPAIDFTLNINYQVTDNFSVTPSLQLVGKRYAKGINNVANELDPFVLVGLRADIKISKMISAYLTSNNLLNNQYVIWDNYAGYGAFIQAGIKLNTDAF